MPQKGKAIPGIVWVESDTIKPEKLSKDDLRTWSQNENIPEVVSKSGVRSAHRYEAATGGPTRSNSARRQLSFLTVYELPDVNFVKTAEYQALEGERPGGPNKEKIFDNSEFLTRSYEVR